MTNLDQLLKQYKDTYSASERRSRLIYIRLRLKELQDERKNLIEERHYLKAMQ